jgi:hypothetical protein
MLLLFSYQNATILFFKSLLNFTQYSLGPPVHCGWFSPENNSDSALFAHFLEQYFPPIPSLITYRPTSNSFPHFLQICFIFPPLQFGAFLPVFVA